MLDRDRHRVAVVGAAGFVGRHLMAALEDQGVAATAIVRGAPEMAVAGTFHSARHPSDLRGDRFDVVVNLAFPKGGSPHRDPVENRALVTMLDDLVCAGGRIVHVSTQAVFGLALDRPVTLGAASDVRDGPYVEVKLDAERRLRELQRSRGVSLDIVRLGNVFGVGSAIWGVAIVHRLITGRPVGVDGHPGFSNVTDVLNAASYLAYLVDRGSSAAGVRYHHVAEFSGVMWPEWITPISDALEVEPVLADPRALDMPPSGLKELAQALNDYTPRMLYRRLADVRVAGSWSRTVRRSLSAVPLPRGAAVPRVHASGPPRDPNEQTFLSIMSATQQFKLAVDAQWHPPVTQTSSLERFIQWTT